MLTLIYIPLMVYSLFCGPTLFFRLFPDADTDSPEVAFGYIGFCLLAGVTLIAGIARAWQLFSGTAHNTSGQE